MIDRRSAEIRTDSITIGLVLIGMGWYASPWQPMDTLFTITLARAGLENLWAFFLVFGGGFKVMVSCVPCRLRMGCDSVVNTFNAIVMIWTFLIFVQAGILTPTVTACGVIGAGAIASVFRDAFKSRKMRAYHGRLIDHIGI